VKLRERKAGRVERDKRFVEEILSEERERLPCTMTSEKF
jgi:hypothetical protein